ncbi:uncharacterized protein LOC130811201 [Amaranthus tricolor]|uniref:uncharacterized protein LOC130811201 n=1 Tax=Amaranthus tricolor TaxID=29722 RepID=UPI002586BAA3|nr:uncharacterized protein LOC130811201 [Amaranthus tricolor]
MESYRVTILCFWNGAIQTSNKNVEYVGGKHKLFVCNSNMNLNELKLHICSKIGIDSTSTVNISFKYGMSGQFLAFPIEDEDALEAMWEYSKSTPIPSLELYVEEVPLRNRDVNIVETDQVLNVTSTSSPAPMPFLTKETQNLSTPYEPPQMQVSNNLKVNLGATNEGISWESDNESNEFVDAPSEDDVRENEDALGNDLNLGNIPTIVPPTPYALVPPLDEHIEDNSWRSWTCETTFTEEGEFQKDQVFDNKESLLEAVRLYHIRRNVEYRTETSNQTVISLKCKRGCSWKLRARKNNYSSAWHIVTYKGKHDSCVLGSDNVSVGRIHLTSSVINNLIRNNVVQDPSIKVSMVQQMVKDRFGIKVTYKLAWYAKQQALQSIYGSWEDSYSLLPRFLKAMQHSNPGTVVEWFFKEDNDVSLSVRSNTRTFQRVFWAFKPSIEGFKHCKPLIAIDGTHLYGKYCHTLLTAIAQDGNKGIFPLAFALVEKDCIAAWSWFMACIRKHMTQRMGLCIISDRHAGILSTMEEPEWQPPHAHHRFCIRHLLSNFNRHIGDVNLKKLFGRTAIQTQPPKVIEGLREIGAVRREALFWIDQVGDMSKWSLCHDGGHRYGVTNTNLAEVFNTVMKGVRFLPLTTLVEFSFYRVNDYFVKMRESASEWITGGHMYTSHATKIITRNTEKANFHEIVAFDDGRGIFQVKTGRGNRGSSKGGNIQIVDLGEKKCTCNKLEIYHLPCSHVLAVCIKRNLSYEQFVDPCYTTESYASTYRSCFIPLIDKRAWPQYSDFELRHDPNQIRGVGRPKFKRVTNEMDEGITY